MLAIWLQTVIGAVTVFYSLLVVTLLVPVLGGLYVPRRGQPRKRWPRSLPAWSTLFVVRFGCAGAYPWLDPALAGIIVGRGWRTASSLAFRRESDPV